MILGEEIAHQTVTTGRLSSFFYNNVLIVSGPTNIIILVNEAIQFENGLIRLPNFIDVPYVGSSLTFFKKHFANSIRRFGIHLFKACINWGMYGFMPKVFNNLRTHFHWLILSSIARC